MWMIYYLPICLSHVSIWVMFFSNTRQHFLRPCMLQPLSVILICYDLCSMFDFVIQYSLPPKVRVFLEVLSIHFGIWWLLICIKSWNFCDKPFMKCFSIIVCGIFCLRDISCQQNHTSHVSCDFPSLGFNLACVKHYWIEIHLLYQLLCL